MTLKQFSANMNRQPFRPFKLVMAGGWDITIDDPTFACIDRQGRIVDFCDKNGTQHTIDTKYVTSIITEDDDAPR